MISSSVGVFADAERGFVSSKVPKAAQRNADALIALRMKFFMRVCFIFNSITYFDENCNSLTGKNLPFFCGFGAGFWVRRIFDCSFFKGKIWKNCSKNRKNRLKTGIRVASLNDGCYFLRTNVRILNQKSGTKILQKRNCMT